MSLYIPYGFCWITKWASSKLSFLLSRIFHINLNTSGCRGASLAPPSWAWTLWGIQGSASSWATCWDKVAVERSTPPRTEMQVLLYQPSKSLSDGYLWTTWPYWVYNLQIWQAANSDQYIGWVYFYANTLSSLPLG